MTQFDDYDDYDDLFVSYEDDDFGLPWIHKHHHRILDEQPQGPKNLVDLESVEKMLKENTSLSGTWTSIDLPQVPAKNSFRRELFRHEEFSIVGCFVLFFGIMISLGALTSFRDSSFDPALVASSIAAPTLVVLLKLFAFQRNKKKPKKLTSLVDERTSSLLDRTHRSGEIAGSKFAAHIDRSDMESQFPYHLQILQYEPHGHNSLWTRVIFDEVAPTDLAAATERAVEVAALAESLEDEIRKAKAQQLETIEAEKAIARDQQMQEASVFEAMQRAITHPSTQTSEGK